MRAVSESLSGHLSKPRYKLYGVTRVTIKSNTAVKTCFTGHEKPGHPMLARNLLHELEIVKINNTRLVSNFRSFSHKFL
jgi:hypothetical protein